jgi:tetratricopeptide (TPR) repeat protein
LKSAPDDLAAYSQLGLAYLQKARETGDPTWYQKAEGALSKTLAGQAADYAANVAMGALELARHQFASAAQWGERARQINPDRAYAFGVMADAQIELGQYAEAVTTLQAMVDLRPDAASYSRISYLRELHGDLDGAIDMMQAAVDAGGANTENSAWLRTQLGHLYFNTGDLARAEIEYQRTLDLAPDYVHALAGLGRVRFAQGRTDEAITRLARAAELMPLPEFVITLGEMYEATGDRTRAQEQYDLVRVIQQLHESNGVDLDLEIALFNADHDLDLAKTLEQARAGYARRPSIYAADVLAWVLYKSGRYEEAQKYSDEALRLGSRDALKFYHAGLIAQQRGDIEQAKTYLKQALAISPHFSILYAPQAQAALDKLIAQVSN